MARLLPAGILLLGVLWIVGTRVHFSDEPLDRDLATYAVAARQMGEGKLLYRDVFDHKPPGIHVTLMLVQGLLGESEETLAVVGALVALATMAAVWAAARAVTGPVLAAFASLCWALTSATLPLQATQLNTEAFVNLFLTLAVAVLVRSPMAFPYAAWAGLLLSMATLYKTVALVPAVALVAATFARGAHPWRRRVTGVLILAVVAAIPWSLVGIFFALKGSWGDLVFAVFTYNSAYAGGITRNLLTGLLPQVLAPPVLAPLLPLFVLTLIGIMRIDADPNPAKRLLLAWMGSTPLAVALPGKFAPHYYQLWLPVLCLGAALVLARVARRSLVLGWVLVLALAALQAPGLVLSSAEASGRKYGPVFLEARELGVRLRGDVARGRSFWHWGAETGLYFYSRFSPVTRFFYNYPVEVAPDRVVPILTREVMAASPDLVVIYRREFLPLPTTLRDWLLTEYRRSEGTHGWEIWERRPLPSAERRWPPGR